MINNTKEKLEHYWSDHKIGLAVVAVVIIIVAIW